MNKTVYSLSLLIENLNVCSCKKYTIICVQPSLINKNAFFFLPVATNLASYNEKELGEWGKSHKSTNTTATQ